MKGELDIKPGSYRGGEQEYPADVGTLAVPENRSRPGSRLITLPLVRLRATAEAPAEPVFMLAGGPGQTNLWKNPNPWLLARHDVVMVGYRGVDGSVSLELPEVAEAMRAEKDPLSGENLKAIGEAWRAGHERLRAEGIDVAAYTMIDVVDDIEAAREALGCGTINLYSWSYGTRLAYIYALRYPDNVRRSVMVGVNPPGRFVWEPATNDRLLAYYGELWRKEEGAVQRCPDLVATIRNVLGQLPREGRGLRLDADKVKIMSFMFLARRRGAAQLFDACVAAEGGDWTGLAYLSASYDAMVSPGPSYGDMAAKAVPADYDPSRDYEAEMDPPGSVLGSPVSKLYWGCMRYGGWPHEPLPEEYRTLRYTHVETLLISGTVDFATPGVYAEQDLLPYLRRGRGVVLAERGHCQDLVGIQAGALEHLVETFYREGEVDVSRFTYEPVNFTPEKTLGDMARELMANLGRNE